MREITLSQYLNEGRTQAEAAEVLGCTQGAVSQMIKADRQIYFVIDGESVASTYERKAPGKRLDRQFQISTP